MGMRLITTADIKSPQSTEYCPTKSCIPTWIVFFNVVLIKMDAYIYSSHEDMKQNRAVTNSPGFATWTMIRKKLCTRPHPSIIADSSSSQGNVLKKAHVFHIANGSVNDMYISISPV